MLCHKAWRMAIKLHREADLLIDYHNYCVSRGWYAYADKIARHIENLQYEVDILLDIPMRPFIGGYIRKRLNEECEYCNGLQKAAERRLKNEEDLEITKILISLANRAFYRYKALYDLYQSQNLPIL